MSCKINIADTTVSKAIQIVKNVPNEFLFLNFICICFLTFLL